MAADKTVVIDVVTKGLAEANAGAEKLASNLDRAAKPRKPVAASNALKATEIETSTGIGRGTAAGASRGDSRDFARQAQGLGGLVHIYATFAANVFAVSAAFTALSKAMDFQNMQKAADVLSTKVGVSINGLAKDMKNLTDGAVSLNDALSQASLAASAGLTAKQIKELTSVAKGASIALGRDMTDSLTRVFRGTVKIEPELLDELGLMVKVNDANKAYAQTLKKSVSSLTDFEKRQAFVNAVTEQGTKKYKELADQTANPYSKLLASIKDVGTTILNVISTAITPFVSLLSQSPTALFAGIAAIAALLIKKTIPAIGDMKKAWEDSAKAAQASVAKKIEGLEKLRAAEKANYDAARREARKDLLATKDALQDTVDKKTLTRTKFGKGLSAFIHESDPSELEKLRKVALADADKLASRLEKDIKKLSSKVAIPLGTKGSFINEQEAQAARDELKRYQNQLAGVELAKKQINNITDEAAKAEQRLQQVYDKSPVLAKLKREEEALQRQAIIRGKLAKVSEVTADYGATAGFRALKTELNTLPASIGTFQKGMLGLKGTFGIVTASVAGMLGPFATWMGILGIITAGLIPFLKWLGLMNDKNNEYADSLDKASESTRTFVEASKKAYSSNNLSDMFDYQTGAAKALVSSIDEATIALEKFKDAQKNSTFINSQIEIFKSFFDKGILGADTYKDIIAGLEERAKTDDQLRAKIEEKFGKNKSISEALKGDAAGLFTSTKTREEFIKVILELSADQETKKKNEELVKSNEALKGSLKELDTISNEYSISIENNSKHLKVLNAFTSSLSNTVKSFGNNGSVTSIITFLKGITEQFQDMSDVPLPDSLNSLQTSLSSLDTDLVNIQSRYSQQIKKLSEEGTGLFGTGLFSKNSITESQKQEGLKALDKTKQFEIDAKQLEISNKKLQIDIELSKYGIKVISSLSNLAKAAAEASIAQAALGQKLKTLSDIAAFGGTGTSKYNLERAQEKADRDRVRIQNSAIINNVNSLQKLLDTTVKSIGKANPIINPIESLPITPEQAMTRISKILTGENNIITPESRASLLQGLSDIQSIQSKITIANAEVTANNLSLPSTLSKELREVLRQNLEKIDNAKASQELSRAKADNSLTREYGSLASVSDRVKDEYEYKQKIVELDDKLLTLELDRQIREESLTQLIKQRSTLEEELLSKKLSSKDREIKEDELKITKDEIKGLERKKELAKVELASTTSEKDRTKETKYLSNKLRDLKEINSLESGRLDILAAQGKLASHEVESQKEIMQFNEQTLLLKEKIALASDNSAAKEQAELDLKHLEALHKQKLELIEQQRIIQQQATDLQNVMSILDNSKNSFKLLNIDELRTATQLYREILDTQTKANLQKIQTDPRLSSVEKMVALEAQRLDYLQKSVDLREKEVRLEDKLQGVYGYRKDLVAEIATIEATKFRDSIDGYNETLVKGANAAIDTFVDGITNAVKTGEFNLKDIVRDTIFAFDDMMLEYAANNMKALLRETVAGFLGDKNFGKSSAEIIAEKQHALAEEANRKFDKMVENTANIVKNTGGEVKDSPGMEKAKTDTEQIRVNADKQTQLATDANGKFDTMNEHLQTIANKMTTSLSSTPGTENFVGSAFNSIDFLGTSQSSMLKAQETGFTPQELAAWGGSLDNMLKPTSKDFQTSAGLTLKSSESLTTAASSMNTAASSLVDSSQSLGSTLGRLFSTIGGGISSAGGGLLDGILGMFGKGSGSSIFSGGFSGGWNPLSEIGLAGSGFTFGFANGGSFEVGGVGATDSKLVQFMATPGEKVTVETPNQQKNSGQPIIINNNFTINGGTTNRESQAQISAKVGQSIQRALTRNN